MSTTTFKLKYRHSEDCIQAGCPSHIASFTYQSTADAYLFNDGNGREYSIERGTIEAFITLINAMNDSNCCCVDVRKLSNTPICWDKIESE